MKISEIRGEHALEVLADILDPVTVIASDTKFQEFLIKGNKIGAAKYLFKKRPKETLVILAYLDGEDPKDYNPTLPQIPAKILEILNDPVFRPFFESQGRSQEDASSGSATENTGATEKE